MVRYSIRQALDFGEQRSEVGRHSRSEVEWLEKGHRNWLAWPQHSEGLADFKVAAVRYIKLGPKGRWARQAFAEGILPFGYRFVDHKPCAEGDWGAVRRQLSAKGRKDRALKDDERELKDFYELGEDTLWFTVADGHVWWTFAQLGVVKTNKDDPDAFARFRRTAWPWRNTSLTGLPLNIRALSSALSSTANYRRTLCTVKQADYLLRRIRGKDEPLRAKADQLMSSLTATAVEMVRQLDWRDFETLVDLIFTYNGWRRKSALGGGQSDIDFIAKQPITGETAWVQVKSHASQAAFEDYLSRFRSESSCGRFFFVYHSADRPIESDAHIPNAHLWSADEVARAAIDAGLFGWISERMA